MSTKKTGWEALDKWVGDSPASTGDAVAVPAGAKTLTAVCGALTNGSGLKGLSLAILDEMGGAIAGATSKEKADTNAYVEDHPVDAAKKFIIKVSADSQDPDVKGAYYRCGFSFATE